MSGTIKATEFRNPFALKLLAKEKGWRLATTRDGTELQARDIKGRLMAIAMLHADLMSSFSEYASKTKRASVRSFRHHVVRNTHPQQQGGSR